MRNENSRQLENIFIWWQTIQLCGVYIQHTGRHTPKIKGHKIVYIELLTWRRYHCHSCWKDVIVEVSYGKTMIEKEFHIHVLAPHSYLHLPPNPSPSHRPSPNKLHSETSLFSYMAHKQERQDAWNNTSEQKYFHIFLTHFTSHLHLVHANYP